MVNTLRIDGRDTVAVALTDLPAATDIEFSDMNGLRVTTQDPIPFGHKVALTKIREGEHVLKYGASIGVATQDIEPGEHVHVHNLKSVRGTVRR